MKKRIILFMAMSFFGCENIYEFPQGVYVKVINDIGTLYSYEIDIDGETAKANTQYELSDGLHVVTLDLYDPSGTHISNTEKMVLIDGDFEVVYFFLYFVGSTEVSTK
jgi:hypothetical protein